MRTEKAAFDSASDEGLGFGSFGEFIAMSTIIHEKCIIVKIDCFFWYLGVLLWLGNIGFSSVSSELCRVSGMQVTRESD